MTISSTGLGNVVQALAAISAQVANRAILSNRRGASLLAVWLCGWAARLGSLPAQLPLVRQPLRPYGLSVAGPLPCRHGSSLTSLASTIPNASLRPMSHGLGAQCNIVQDRCAYAPGPLPSYSLRFRRRHLPYPPWIAALFGQLPEGVS